MEDQSMKQVALDDIRGKLSPTVARQLREAKPDVWHKALSELKASIDDEQAAVKIQSESERRPVDMQMFHVKWGWIQGELDKKLKESKELVLEKERVKMGGNMSELVNEFKAIRQLLERLVGGK